MEWVSCLKKLAIDRIDTSWHKWHSFTRVKAKAKIEWWWYRQRIDRSTHQRECFFLLCDMCSEYFYLRKYHARFETYTPDIFFHLQFECVFPFFLFVLPCSPDRRSGFRKKFTEFKWEQYSSRQSLLICRLVYWLNTHLRHTDVHSCTIWLASSSA